MDLKALHAKLSRDKSYTSAYKQLDGYPELVVHCLAVREDRGLTQEELATQSGLKIGEVADFEHFDCIDPEVVSSIVDCLEPWLRQRAVKIDQWIQVAPRRARSIRTTDRPSNSPNTRGLTSRPAVLPSNDRDQVPESEDA